LLPSRPSVLRPPAACGLVEAYDHQRQLSPAAQRRPRWTAACRLPECTRSLARAGAGSERLFIAEAAGIPGRNSTAGNALLKDLVKTQAGALCGLAYRKPGDRRGQD